MITWISRSIGSGGGVGGVSFHWSLLWEDGAHAFGTQPPPAVAALRTWKKTLKKGILTWKIWVKQCITEWLKKHRKNQQNQLFKSLARACEVKVSVPICIEQDDPCRQKPNVALPWYCIISETEHYTRYRACIAICIAEPYFFYRS